MVRGVTTEEFLRVEVLIPIFQEAGEYVDVIDTHGPDERGKDIVLVRADPTFGDYEYTAVIVKCGDITAATTDRGKRRIRVSEVAHQVVATLNSGYDCIHQNKHVSFTRVIVITNGKITQSAQQELIKLAAQHNFHNLLFKKDVDLVKLIDTYLPSFFQFRSGVLSTYMDALKEKCATLEELRRISHYKGEVRKVIDVFITPVLRRIRTSSTKYRPIFDTLDRIIHQHHNVVIQGGPGAGKSTLVRAQVEKLIDSNHPGRNLRLPIMSRAVTLSKLKGSLVDRLQADITNSLAVANFGLTTYLDDPGIEAFVFIDGLDEIVDEEQRLEFCKLVEEFSNAYRRHRVVLTTRESINLDTLQLSTFRRWELLPFDRRQVERFVRQWFSHVDGGKDAELLAALHDHDLLNKLPSTPLVLTLLAILFESDSPAELPANLSELYRMFVDLLVGKWNLDRTADTLFHANHKEFVLAEVAHHLHTRRQYAITSQELDRLIRESWRSLGLTSDWVEFRRELLEQTGLLVQNERGEIEFRHLSFQEYLVAQRLLMTGEWDGSKEEVIRHLQDDWWIPVIYYYVGIKRQASALLQNLSKATRNFAPLTALRAAIKFGYFIQSSYLTPASVRIECVKDQLQVFASEVETLLREVQDGQLSSDVPPLVAVLGFLFTWHMHYQSRYLTAVYQQAFDELKKENDGTLAMGISLLALATILANVGSYDEMNEMLEIVKPHPLLHLALEFQLRLLLEDEGVHHERARNDIKKLARRLQKTMERSRDVYRVFLGAPTYLKELAASADSSQEDP